MFASSSLSKKVSVNLQNRGGCAVLIRRKTTAITGRHVLVFITGEMFASSCLSKKVSVSLQNRGGCAVISFCVILHLLVLTCTYWC